MLNHLRFGFRHKLPFIFQSEVSECGLACLAMIAGYYGNSVALREWRAQLSPSQKGATLKDVIKMASVIGLDCRPVKLELSDITQLKLPCILHWNFNHFVVLNKITRKGAVIHDPGHGIRHISWESLSDAFTGVALEIWPGMSFQKIKVKRERTPLAHLGSMAGLKRSFAHVILIAIAMELCVILSPFYLSTVVDEIVVTGDEQFLVVLTVGFTILMLAEKLLALARSWVLLFISTMLGLRWKMNVFRHLLSLPVRFFEKRSLGDIVSRFDSINEMQRILTATLIEAFLDGLMAIIMLALMFLYSKVLTLIVVCGMFIYAIMRWIFFSPLRKAQEDEMVSFAHQNSYLIETIRGVKALKLFDGLQERRVIWGNRLVKQINADLGVKKQHIAFMFLNGAVFGLVTILVTFIGAQKMLHGELTVGILLAFIAYKNQFNQRVGSMIDKAVEISMLKLHGERLGEIVLEKSEKSYETPFVSTTLFPAGPEIEVNNLGFQYSDYEPFVFRNVTFTVKSGESVAIVGPSGCGKTTFLNILLGVLNATEGNLAFNGIVVNETNVHLLRSITATVLQDDVLFAGSLIENIAFFAHDLDQEWVENCARLACIHDDIIRMPMGYNTMVGDMGAALSGGQKQRILLARALYKRPKLLLLDEATSHLDIDNERKVNEALKNLSVTRIIIAHRPETISSADRVIYF